MRETTTLYKRDSSHLPPIATPTLSGAISEDVDSLQTPLYRDYRLPRPLKTKAHNSMILCGLASGGYTQLQIEYHSMEHANTLPITGPKYWATLPQTIRTHYKSRLFIWLAGFTNQGRWMIHRTQTLYCSYIWCFKTSICSISGTPRDIDYRLIGHFLRRSLIEGPNRSWHETASRSSWD